MDDIVFGGNKQFHSHVINQLKSIFTIGLEEDTLLKYLGLLISQNSSGIKVSIQLMIMLNH